MIRQCRLRCPRLPRVIPIIRFSLPETIDQENTNECTGDTLLFGQLGVGLVGYCRQLNSQLSIDSSPCRSEPLDGYRGRVCFAQESLQPIVDVAYNTTQQPDPRDRCPSPPPDERFLFPALGSSSSRSCGRMLICITLGLSVLSWYFFNCSLSSNSFPK